MRYVIVGRGGDVPGQGRPDVVIKPSAGDAPGTQAEAVCDRALEIQVGQTGFRIKTVLIGRRLCFKARALPAGIRRRN